jgi:hypothetical protein
MEEIPAKPIVLKAKIEKRKLEIHTEYGEYIGKIEQLKGDDMVILCNKEVPKGEKTVHIIFENRGELYLHSTSDFFRDGKRISLKKPELLRKIKKREHPRAKVYGHINVLFTLPEEEEMKVDDSEVPKEMAVILNEVNKAQPNIKKIRDFINIILRKFSPFIEIVIFDEEEKSKKQYSLSSDDEEMPFEVKVCVSYDRLVYIKKSDDVNSYILKYDDPNIISYGRYFSDRKKEGVPLNDIKQEIYALMMKDKKRDFYSYACIPIRAFGSVKGYIRVATSIYRKEIFPIRTLKTLLKFAGFLGEALEKRKLFSFDRKSRFQKKAIDLGTGGIRFEVEKIETSAYIMPGTRLILMFKLPEKVVTTKGILIRKDDYKDKYHFAVMFENVPSEVKNLIEKYIMTKKQVLIEG